MPYDIEASIASARYNVAFSRADRDGPFVIDDVPPGRYVIEVHSTVDALGTVVDREPLWTGPLQVTGEGAAEVSITLP